MTPERLLDFADWLDKCLMHEESRIEITEFLRECAKAEPVAEITRNPSWDMFSNVNAVKKLPVGTKLYAHPKQEQTVFEQLKTQMKNDADYAWSWHCNIAMSIYDAGLVDHARANHCAAEVMRRLFGVEPVRPLPELKQPTNVLDSMLRRNALIIANARRLIRDKRMSNSRLYAELFGTGMGIAIKRCDEMSLCPESNKTSYSEMINEIDAQVQAQSCATPANDEPVGVARTNAMLKQGDTFCVFELGSVPEGTKLYTHPPKQEQSPIDERAEFERWANENKGGEPLQLGGGGTYPNPFANAAFEAWQARAKLSALIVLDEKRGLVVDDVEDRCEVDCAIAYANGWNACRATVIKETE